MVQNKETKKTYAAKFITNKFKKCRHKDFLCKHKKAL